MPDLTGTSPQVDVVVVGAGSSGSTLAARLSERSSRSVLLIESGADPGPSWPEEVRDAASLPGPSDPWVSRLDVALAGGRTVPLLAGHIVGGSSAVNGAYFVRATRSDLDGWADLGLDLWSHEQLLPVHRRIENDRDLGHTRGHGDRGPVPVTRAAEPLHPVTAAFFAACEQRGHTECADLNGDVSSGYGLVPRNVDPRGRVSAAMAFLDPVRDRPNLSIRADCTALRVVIDRGAAVGVEIRGSAGAQVVRAGTVVLSAGAVGSARLLFASGVGPADVLRATGTEPVVDAVGLGTRVSNHPALDLRYRPAAPVADESVAFLQGALHLVTAAGTPVEVLATKRSYGRVTGAAPDDDTLSLRVSLMATRSRGRLRPGPVGTTLQLGYLSDPDDRADLRDAVRSVVELAHSSAFAPSVARWLGPDADTVADERQLDAWIAAELGTSMHPCSTAPMGPDDDPDAVVDQLGRVRGVEGLRVVDTAILPSAPSRGPACTAIALAEHLAGTFD